MTIFVLNLKLIDMTEEEKLKSIVGYLPYGVEIDILNYKRDYVGIKKGIVKSYYILNNEIYLTYIGGSTGKSFDDFRLLLYPLSSLTEYREDLGFVPVEYFEITDDSDSYPFEFDSGNIKLIRDLVSISKNNCSFDINFLPNVVVDKFKEWHIDYLNLIEKGFAIDKKKIK